MGVKARMGRVLVALGVGGAILAGPLGLGQASAASLASFSSTGSGYALRVTLDLSGLKKVSGLEGALNTAWHAAGRSGTFPFVIDQFLVKTSTDGDSKLTSALSVLGEGFTNFNNARAGATGVGQSTSNQVASQKLPTDALPIVNVAVGTLKAAVASGPVVTSNGTLAKVSADLKDMLGAMTAQGVDLSSVTAAVNNLLAQVNGSSGAIATLQNTIADGLASTVVTGGASAAPVTSAVTSLPTVGPQVGSVLGNGNLSSSQKVTQITSQLSSALSLAKLPDIFATDLASVNSLTNAATAKKAGTLVSADASSQLKSVSALGGFIQTSLVTLSSHSEAAGTPGSAKDSSSCSIADVRIGGSNGVSLDGKTVYINGLPVPLVGNVVTQVKGLVDSLLSTLGVKVSLCDTVQKEADADGTAAAQQVSALHVEVAPNLPALGQLVKLTVDPTVSTAVAAQVASAPTSTAPLAHTGPSVPLTIFVGLAVAGAAIVLRRRLT